MAEEKENCKFQQDYNVFGLDDKPCCYLYHKYCDDIDDCYYKQLKRLEQENKELKADVLKWQKAFSRQYQINENKGYSKAEEKYRSALEEIRNLCNKGAGVYTNAKVVGLINEVLNEQDN